MTIDVARKIVQKILLAEKIILPVEVKFSNRMTRAKGLAKCLNGKFSITLSKKLFLLDTKQNNLNTVIHETCHIVCFVKHQGSAHHGRQWKNVMLRHGGVPKRCHSVKIKINRQPKVNAYCGCGRHPITLNRQTRMKRGSTYICVNCKKRLSLLAYVKRGELQRSI